MARPNVSILKLGLMAGLIVVILDQASKLWIYYKVMDPPRVIEILPFFNIVSAWNRGVSFGMFNSGDPLSPWVFIILSFVISAGLAIWLWKAETRLLGGALGLVIGGAMGNVIDRFNFGAVYDFLDFHIAGTHWPAFNIADSAICIGAGLLILDSFRDGLSKADETNKKGESESS